MWKPIMNSHFPGFIVFYHFLKTKSKWVNSMFTIRCSMCVGNHVKCIEYTLILVQKGPHKNNLQLKHRFLRSDLYLVYCISFSDKFFKKYWAITLKCIKPTKWQYDLILDWQHKFSTIFNHWGYSRYVRKNNNLVI